MKSCTASVHTNLCVVITVPADGLALLGARPSAATMRTNLQAHICIGPALEGSTKLQEGWVGFVQPPQVTGRLTI